MFNAPRKSNLIPFPIFPYLYVLCYGYLLSGISKRLRVEPDVGGEGGGRLVAGKDVECEDVLVSVDPSVAVVNVSGGRAGGKICPHKVNLYFVKKN